MRSLRLSLFSLCLLALLSAAFAQEKASHKKESGGSAVDKAYLQKIWDGWCSLNVPGQAQFYAQGAHVFFDIAPLKYDGWDEYQAGVTKVLSGYQSGTCRVNDDAEIHRAGNNYWITATVATDLVQKAGKHDMATMRWTAIFEKIDGKWLIIHEHVSEPLGQ